MKKIITVALSIFAFLAVSCNFTFAGEDLLTKPDVEKKDSVISISVPRQNNSTRYINLYRKDCEDSDETVVSLGMIYPDNYESIGSAYIFMDSLVHKDHKYTYRARYFDGSDYYYTEWSNEIIAAGGFNEDKLLKYKNTDATLLLNETDYTLKITGTIGNADIPDFDKEYKPMIIISSDEKTEIFQIESVADGTLISLRGILPLDFFDKKIRIDGIVGQKIDAINTDDSEADPIIKSLIWTEPTEIELTGYKNNTFIIPSVAGSDGVDFS